MAHYYGAIGSDGHRLVFWGLGTTPRAAERDAMFWHREGDVEYGGVSIVRISKARYKAAKSGDIDAEGAIRPKRSTAPRRYR
jgi:hypothetical protein